MNGLDNTKVEVIAGLAHDEHRLLHGRELLNKAHVSGRVEYNGLTREVSSLTLLFIDNLAFYIKCLYVLMYLFFCKKLQFLFT